MPESVRGAVVCGDGSFPAATAAVIDATAG